MVLLAVLMIMGLSQVSAQTRFGVVGGVNFSESNYRQWENDKIVQYQAGLTCLVKLPHGFAIQPSLLYQAKGLRYDPAAGTDVQNVAQSIDVKMGFIEVPVSIQWGIDLLVVRPYIEVVPFIGCAVANNGHDWNDLNRFEGGVGVGGGIDIWKFQIAARYNWNLGNLTKTGSTLNETSGEFIKSNFRGVTLSLAFLF